MDAQIALSPRLYFSYNQFMVYDQSVRLPGCAWTDAHSAQGFARRQSVVNFNTPLEFGYADVFISRNVYQPSEEFDRVIAVPFLVTSGKVVVEGPEETKPERNVALSPGNYRLVAAQRVTGDEEEAIHLFFEPLSNPLERSAVLVADEALYPPTPLLETAEIAGEE
jgi:hypothetical protein